MIKDCDVYYTMFLSIYLFSCLHFEIISDFLLSNFSLNLTLCLIMYSFSVTHRLHFFFPGVNGSVPCNFFHDIVKL